MQRRSATPDALDEPSQSSQPYAGIVTRTVAFALDIAILQGGLLIAGIVVGLIVEAFGDFSPDVNSLSVALAAIGWFLAFTTYFSTFWSLTGQTPGMRALGIRVTATTGERLTPRRSILRVACMIAAALPFFAGYLLILIDDRRRGLHDLVARTVVRYAESRT
jgi:uncharacterized RDD family membrane protein YckC